MSLIYQLCDNAETVVCWAPRLESCRASVMMTYVAVMHLNEMEETDKFLMYQCYHNVKIPSKQF